MYWRRSITPGAPKTWTSDIYFLHRQEDDTDWERYEEPEEPKDEKSKKGHDYDWAIDSYDCGMKVRRASWPKSLFIYLAKDNNLVLAMENDNNPIKLTSPLHLSERDATDWELYEEPKRKEEAPKVVYDWDIHSLYEEPKRIEVGDLIWAVSKINEGFHVSMLRAHVAFKVGIRAF